ncbi:MAG: DUF4230 domain-containing protein [Saccharofermentans sp.]|nr:DUF4230 domain-containing protein [Saccharofermentans sp.]
MKKLFSIFLVLSLLFAMAGCNSKPKEEPKKAEATIEVDEMRAIANLATVDCYFHNVAKSDREMNPAWYQFWEKKNMRFWVEYDGRVTIGIDVNKLKVEVGENNVVTITMPNAVVLDATVNEQSLTSESFYFDPKAKKPSPEEQTEAFKQAQSNMRETAEKNPVLMANAKANAKELLRNYVNSVGEAVGVQYTIEWKDIDDPSKAAETDPPPTESKAQ